MNKNFASIIYVNLAAVLGLASVWVIYEHQLFLIAAFASLLVANLLAFFKQKLRLRGLTFFFISSASYYLLAFALLSRFNFKEFNFLAFVMSPILTWKDILTLDLPLGAYQMVLAPVILVILLFVTGALTLFNGAKKHFFAAVFFPWGILLFGIVFGSAGLTTVHSSGLTLQLIIGFVSFFVLLTYVFLTTRTSGRKTGVISVIAAVVTTIVAFGSAGFIASTVAGAHKRDVLRTAVQPVETLGESASPLSGYRAFYADENYGDPLFTFAPDGVDSRIRIATMGFYDGKNMLLSDAQSPRFTTFKRVPQLILAQTPFKLADDPDLARLRISAESWPFQWLPLAGELQSISFVGENSAAMLDGFYLHAESATAVHSSQSLGEGVLEYDFLFTENDRKGPLESLGSLESDGSAGFVPAKKDTAASSLVVPEQLADWIKQQGVSADFEGFLALTETIKNASYLSHSFMAENGEPLWLQERSGHAFMPSRSGHHLDRITNIFESLIETTDLNRATVTVDEEQLSVAIFLLAAHYGYDARVVLGVDPAECDDGICLYQNVRAWVEIREAESSRWGIVDANPLAEKPPVTGVVQTSDPKNHTEVKEEAIDYVSPADPIPAGELNESDLSERNTINLYWLKPLIKNVTISLLILLAIFGPFLLPIGLKTLRRRRRKKTVDPTQKTIAAWDELHDYLLDLKIIFPVNSTRLEISQIAEEERVGACKLAKIADLAEFSGRPVDSIESNLYWDAVEKEMKTKSASLRFFERLRVLISIRSIKKRRGADAIEADLLKERERKY